MSTGTEGGKERKKEIMNEKMNENKKKRERGREGMEINKRKPGKTAQTLTLLTCIGSYLVRIPAGTPSIMTEVFHPIIQRCITQRAENRR